MAGEDPREWGIGERRRAFGGKPAELPQAGKGSLGGYIETRTYVFGGVDFSDLSFDKVDGDGFERRWSGRSQNVQQSLTTPVTGKAGDAEAWLGGNSPGSTAQGPGILERLGDGDLVVRLLVAAGCCVLLAVSLRSVHRLRGRRSANRSQQWGR
ncbi:hypothetical protein [Streptomyces sp. NPDC014995]|uniref:hypothetical protein n=1 Tax=Streptomyces sp. NPDC014995 TaxID=3364936 RepID=UPI0036F62B5F